MNLELIEKIVIITLGVYEVLTRVIPTIRDWTILGNIIKFLRIVSDWLNNTDKVKKV